MFTWPSKLTPGFDFHIRTILILSKFFYTPTDAQVNCPKNNFKIYIKIDIKTAQTRFGAVTPSSGSALAILTTVTLARTSNVVPDDGFDCTETCQSFRFV